LLEHDPRAIAMHDIREHTLTGYSLENLARVVPAHVLERPLVEAKVDPRAIRVGRLDTIPDRHAVICEHAIDVSELAARKLDRCACFARDVLTARTSRANEERGERVLRSDAVRVCGE